MSNSQLSNGAPSSAVTSNMSAPIGMVASSWGEAMEAVRAADSLCLADTGVVTAGPNLGIEFDTSCFRPVLFLPGLVAGGTSLKITTSFSSADL